MVQVTETEKNGSCQRLWEGNGKFLCNEYRVSVLQDEQRSGDGWRQCFPSKEKLLDAAQLCTNMYDLR